MPIVVAVPARDEHEHITACLQALNGQVGARPDHVVVFINNSTDATARLARAFFSHAATQLHVIERDLPPAQANAGHARRFAMEAAFALAGPQGTLLTTDADGEVDPGWLAANLAALAAGVDVVAGWIDLHAADAVRIPLSLQEDDARECAYDALCDEIHAQLDPDPADPMPRHTQHSGASIAVTAAAFARSGGVPAMPCGEDRAFIAALRRIDARIRHAPEVHVTVSGRIEGRSPGGMADTIRRRLLRPDEFLDDRLEPATDCVRRARSRADLRLAYRDPGLDKAGLARGLGLPLGTLAAALAAPYFGAAWDVIETQSPVLRRHLVRHADVSHQIDIAEAIVATLRAGSAMPGFSDRGDRSGSHSLAPETSE